LRTFLAIELDKDTSHILYEIQNKLRENGVRGNYTRLENLHLTVKFLGEINIIQYNNTIKFINRIVQDYNSFVLTLNKIGKFDRRNRMIIWAGLFNNESLAGLHDNIDRELSSIIGLQQEKSYLPHITLVREAQYHGSFEYIMSKIGVIGHSFTAQGISLMESARLDGRLTYIRRYFEPFNTKL
jgi:2'-5' RNA ligase